MRPNKKLDLIILVVIILAGYALTVIFNLKPLIGGLLSLVPSSLYLILREKKNLRKIFWAVVIFGIIFAFIFDFIVTFNEGWVVTRLVFPWRLFGFYPFIDDVLGFMAMTLITVLFYEHFLDDEKNPKVSRNLIRALVVPLIVLGLILVVYLINPAFLKIPYVYLVTGILAIILPVAFVVHKPHFAKKFLALAAFFFFVWFLAELAALKVGGWIFPGQYIGSVEILGLRFPFEELFFWMLFYAATIVAYYEHYIDDAK